MTTNTPNIVAPLWDAAQASPWIPHNKGFRIFDAFALATTVESRVLNSPPGSCADGARYLVAAGASGAWAGQTGKLAIAVGANASSGWYFATVALSGMTIFVRDESPTVTRYYGGAWHDFIDGLSRFQDMVDVSVTGLVDGDVFVWDASNGLLFPQTVANLVNPLLAPYLQATLDTDGTLAANSDSRVASQKAVRTYVAAAVLGVFDLRGTTDCSANPNYPAAVKGDTYVVSVAGKIGGAAGVTVAIGDIYFATADNAGGTQAAVGASWDTVVHAGSLSGALLAALNLSDLASPAAARGNLGATTVGGNVFTIANPSAIRFFRVNADNSVSLLDAASFRTAIGAGSSSASRLQDLGDVDTSTLADGEVMKWDASNGMFYFAQDIGWPFATAADIRGGTEAQRAVAPDQLAAAQAPQTLTDAATINWDMALGFNAKVTLGGNRTLAVANPQQGQTYSLGVTQDGTGTRTMTWPGSFDWGTTGAPTLTTTINKRDRITLFCTDAATPKFDAFLSGKGFS